MAFLWIGHTDFYLTKMYIEIEEDIIEDAIANAKKSVNTSLDLLYLFALSAYKGRHYITVPCLVNNKEMCDKLEQLMSRRVLNMLRSTEREYVQWGIIRKNIVVHAIITSKKMEPDESSIVVNPYQISNFEPYSKCRVLTEHIHDSLFFEYLVNYYKCKHGLSKCNFTYEPLMGGGSTTADILMREACEREHFCLVISDSDKKAPDLTRETTDKGTVKPKKEGLTTSEKIEVVMGSLKPFNCCSYVMKRVREIENLMPKKVIEIIAPNRGYMKIFDKDPSFFDMKSGLNLTDLFDDDICNYWKELLKDESVDFTERDEVKKLSTSKDSYKTLIKDKSKRYTNQLCAGFGSNLLEMCVLKDKGIAHPEVKDALMKIKDEDLTDAQLEEWSKIGQIMFSWTCSSRKYMA